MCAQISEGCVLAPDVWILGTCPCGTCFILLPLCHTRKKGGRNPLSVTANKSWFTLFPSPLAISLVWPTLMQTQHWRAYLILSWPGELCRSQTEKSVSRLKPWPLTTACHLSPAEVSSSSWKRNIKMIPKSESWETNCLSDVPCKLSENQKYTPLLQKYPHDRNNPETKHAWDLHRHCQIIRGTHKIK